MRTGSSLHKMCDRAMITPVPPLHTRFIHISPSYWTIILNWELSIGIKFKSNVLCKSTASKNNTQSGMNYISENT